MLRVKSSLHQKQYLNIEMKQTKEIYIAQIGAEKPYDSRGIAPRQHQNYFEFHLIAKCWLFLMNFIARSEIL